MEEQKEQKIYTSVTSNETPSKKSNNGIIYSLMTALIVVVVIVIILISKTGKTDYEEGVEYLRAKQYDAALVEFQMVKPSDKNYILAQSKINYINGIKAYNDGLLDQAKVYLSKVDARDEYYGESQLLLEKIASNINGTQQAEKPRTQPAIKEKIETKKQTETKEIKNTDEQISRNFLSRLGSIQSKFQSYYESAYTASVPSKRNYLNNMSTVLSELNGTSYTAADKNTMLIDLKELMSKWMSRRIDFISRLIADNTINETANTRQLKEEGDKLYQTVLRQLNKVRDFYRT